LDSLEKLETVRFCLVSPLHIYKLDEQEHALWLDILVLELKLLTDPAPQAAPNMAWLELLDSETSAAYVHVQHLEKYTVLDINIQGDLGVSVILPPPVPNIPQQVALHAWDFHLNVWYFYQGDLSLSQKQRFGLLPSAK
jgi:hypothetical protein